MTPARCERSREAVSLRLDGLLSAFEQALLGRHLDTCAECCAFAEAAEAQTTILRLAPLEAMAVPVELPRPVIRAAGGRVIGVLAAAAAAGIAALASFGPGSHSTSVDAARAQAASGPMLVVVARAPSPSEKDIEVPRLRVQPASVVDKPIHGFFDEPAQA